MQRNSEPDEAFPGWTSGAVAQSRGDPAAIEVGHYVITDGGGALLSEATLTLRATFSVTDA